MCLFSLFELTKTHLPCLVCKISHNWLQIDPTPTKKNRFKGRSYTLGHFWWKKHKEEKKNAEHQQKIEEKTKKCEEKNHETASLQNEPGLISADPGQSTNENQCTQVDIRSRLHNLAFIFSLPHLVMLSNLQKLIGIRTGRKPSIQVWILFWSWIQPLTVSFVHCGYNRINPRLNAQMHWLKIKFGFPQPGAFHHVIFWQ